MSSTVKAYLCSGTLKWVPYDLANFDPKKYSLKKNFKFSFYVDQRFIFFICIEHKMYENPPQK